MKRREFLGLMGGTAAAWPLPSQAQQAQLRRFGVLVGLAPSADAPTAQAFIMPFPDAMRKAGWLDDQNIRIDYRFGGALADLAKTRTSAGELVALTPDVIYAQGLPATLALHQLTTTVPVFWPSADTPQLARSPRETITRIGVCCRTPATAGLFQAMYARCGFREIDEPSVRRNPTA